MGRKCQVILLSASLGSVTTLVCIFASFYMSFPTGRGRRPVYYQKYYCLNDQCGSSPAIAGFCKKCYAKRYRMKVAETQKTCRAAGCPLKPRTRGYCHACLKLFPNEKPRKPRKSNKIGPQSQMPDSLSLTPMIHQSAPGSAE